MSFKELAGRCNGRWPEIVASLSAQVEMQDAIERGPRQHGFCPVHGGEDGDGFRIYDDFDVTGGAVCNTCGSRSDGFALLAWLNDWDWATTAKAIEDYLGDGRATATNRHRQTPVVRTPKPDKAPPFEVLRRLWNEGHLLRSPAAVVLRRYLAKRGVDDIHPMPMALKFHTRMLYTDYGADAQRERHPAMMAPLTGPDGKMVALMRTYLSTDGNKASVKTPKKLLRARDAQLSGAAIRLFAAGPVLGVTEGIENALSVYQATGMPVWAASNTALLGNLEIPAAVERVVIWADNDVVKAGKQAGRIAAEKLQDRLLEQGFEVEIRYPTLPAKDHGVDWNDVLLETGVHGFPNVVTTAKPLPTARSLMSCA